MLGASKEVGCEDSGVGGTGGPGHGLWYGPLNSQTGLLVCFCILYLKILVQCFCVRNKKS